MPNNMKLKKLKKAGKILAATLAITTTLTAGTIGVSMYNALHPKNVSNVSTPPSQTQVVNDYINTIKYNEFFTYDEQTESIPITLNNYDHMQLINYIKSNSNQEFQYSEYYGLDDALKLYYETEVNKSLESSLLNSDGKLDPQKLVETVLKNNEIYMSGDKNTINVFYKDLETTEITNLCQTIAEIANNTLSPTQLKRLANTLTELKMFKRTGCASNAYVTDNITLVYNPTMTNNYSAIKGIEGQDPEMALKSVIAHEIMHLIQYSSSDINNDNGVEAAICRMYNTQGKDPKIPVDSLWLTWALEASAEMSMSEYLNTPTGTYAKKIGYIDSYNLSRFNELSSTKDTLENALFNPDLESAYNQLGLETEEEKRDFLNYMYSVEITQSDTPDFFAYYQAKTNQTLTDEEKLAIRMDIREDAVMYLTDIFYTNLANAINEGNITDLNTVFYLVRTWELDAYNHLKYTKTRELEHAKNFIEWQHNLQENLFTSIASSSNLDKNDIIGKYNEYNLNVETETGEVTKNCNLDSFNAFQKYYLGNAPSNYSTSEFSHNSDVYEYITNSNQRAAIQKALK